MGLEQAIEFFVNNLVVIIVVVYMVSMIAIGYLVQRKGADKSAENYLIASEGVGPLMVGGTVFSTYWCGGVLLGAAGTAYAGYVVSTIADPWATCLTLVLMAVFFCAILRKLKIASLNEMYRLRFGKRGATVAILMCILSMITWTAANIVALVVHLSRRHARGRVHRQYSGGHDHARAAHPDTHRHRFYQRIRCAARRNPGEFLKPPPQRWCGRGPDRVHG